MAARVLGSESLLRKLEQLGEVARGQTMERAVVAGALLPVNRAKEFAPYITSNLRRSIHIGGHEDMTPDYSGIQRERGALPVPEIGEHDASIYWGTNVEYAARVEFGYNDTDSLGRTYNQAAQPYMRPAIDETRDQVRQEIAEALRDLIQAAIA